MHACGFRAFDTYNTIHLEGLENGAAAALLDGCQRLAARYERLFSHTLPESSLVRINRAGGAGVAVESELAQLVGKALEYCRASAGLFDISVGPLVALWDFSAHAQEPRTVPQPAALARALEHVGWSTVRVDGCTVELGDPAASLVLGGIAKGFIADELVAQLKRGGARHGLVNLGGNVRVFGGKASGEPFTIGLRAPRPSTPGTPDDQAVFATVQLFDGAVVTSGIYERAFTASDGSFYHHILDPRTGMPAATDVASASIVSACAIDGDAWATTLILMGSSSALECAEELGGCEAVLVTREGRVVHTGGIGSRVPFALC